MPLPSQICVSTPGVSLHELGQKPESFKYGFSNVVLLLQSHLGLSQLCGSVMEAIEHLEAPDKGFYIIWLELLGGLH